MQELNKLQAEVCNWAARNFPSSFTPDTQFLGVVEEVGELSHALLKAKQGIRGTSDEHRAAAKDAVGDIMIFLLNFCSANGWMLGNILTETWDQVRQRNWQKNPETGAVDEN